MKKILFPALATLVLTACISSDDNATSSTTSLETCSNVTLGQGRREAAALLELNTDQPFTNALAVYKVAVSNGQRLTANLEVPDDKDYNMALFDTNGNKLGCSDNAGLGTNEVVEYEVNNLSMVWVKVWTALSPSNSAFVLSVNTPVESVAQPLDEVEPNNSIAAAQQISFAHSEVSGNVTDDILLENNPADADDYFSYSVSEGDVVTIHSEVVTDDSSLIYIAVQNASGTTLSNGDGEMFYNFTQQAPSVDFSYTVPSGLDTLIVWMSAIPGQADYTTEVQITTP